MSDQTQSPSGATVEHPHWAIKPASAVTICDEFIQKILAASGKDKLVLGLSGGIDSAVAAGLAVHALGAHKVLGIMMPYASSSAASLEDAEAVAQALGMATEKVNITPMADAFLADIPEQDKVRRGNIMARCRMVVLYDRSARDNSLVLGTGNRTEALLGYTTLFGDSACALNPLGQLYKTEVRLLSQHLGLPEEVLTKAPSADLWEGQSDEDELGFTYAEVDRLFHHMIDCQLPENQLLELGFAAGLIDKVRSRVKSMAFKRMPAPVAGIAGRVNPDAITKPDFKDGGFH
jgi:NAD+ synthase